MYRGIKNLREINGVAIRIGEGEYSSIEILVQDDLTGLDKLTIAGHGHRVAD